MNQRPLSFAFTAALLLGCGSSTITDIKVEKGLSKELNERAKEILLKGPRWLPAYNHGYIAVDGYGFVTIDFINKQ